MKIEKSSVAGLGTARLRSVVGGLSEGQALSLLTSSLELGINLFDTANVYGQGDAERTIGRAFETMRNDVVLCTKVGYSISGRSSLAAKAKPILRLASRVGALKGAIVSQRQRRGTSNGSSSDELLLEVTRTLRRLRTDYIDVLLVHNPSANRIAPDIVREFARTAVQRGYARRTGVAAETVEEAAQWIRDPAVSVIETPAPLGKFDQMNSLFRDRTTTVLGGQITSAGSIFEPAQVVTQLESQSEYSRHALSASMRRSALGYISSLLTSGTVDHILIGTTQLCHVKAALDAVQQGGKGYSE